MKKTFVFKESKVAVKVLSLLLVLFVVLSLGSCTSTTKAQILLADDVPIEGSGYIYGNFGLPVPAGGSTSPQYGIATAGIIVQNLDTFEQYSFILKVKYPERFQITAVPPGNYRIASIEYILKGAAKKFGDFDVAWYQRDFVVEPNTAVYIGDFEGSSSHIQTQYSSNTSWSLEEPVNNYDETTVTVKEMYPFFTEPPITFVSNMKDPQISDTEEPSASDN